MKSVLLAMVVMWVSGSAQADEINSRIATVASDPQVTSMIEKIIKNGSESDLRSFKGLVVSNAQATSCEGDRTYFDALFTRVRRVDGKLVQQTCKTAIRLGECDGRSGKVNSVTDQLDCPSA